MSDYINHVNMYLLWEIFGTALCAGLIPWLFKDKLPKAVIITWTLFNLWQVFHAMTLPWRDTSSYTNAEHAETTPILVYSNLQCLFFMCIYPIMANWYYRRDWMFWFSILMILDFASILCGFQGLMTGRSVDPFFMALLTPYFIKGVDEAVATHKPKMVILEFIPIAVLLAWISYGKSMTALLVMVVSGLVYLERTRGLRPWRPIAILGTIGLACLIFVPHAHLLGAGRLELWSTHMAWWSKHMHHLGGDGLGIYQWLAPFIPVPPDNTHYIIMHNDFLEVLFEDGILGLIGLLVITVSLLRFMWPNALVFSTAVGFICAMLFYYPLHVFAGQMFALLLIFDVAQQNSLKGVTQ